MPGNEITTGMRPPLYCGGRWNQPGSVLPLNGIITGSIL